MAKARLHTEPRAITKNSLPPVDTSFTVPAAKDCRPAYSIQIWAKVTKKAARKAISTAYFFSTHRLPILPATKGTRENARMKPKMGISMIGKRISHHRRAEKKPLWNF